MPSRASRSLRRYILERDDFTCTYCRRRLEPGGLTLDHVVPVSRGGRRSAENLVAACVRCNRRKGSQVWQPGQGPRPNPGEYVVRTLRLPTWWETRLPYAIVQRWMGLQPHGSPLLHDRAPQLRMFLTAAKGILSIQAHAHVGPRERNMKITLHRSPRTKRP